MKTKSTKSKKRLLKLADTIEKKESRNRFYMGSWFNFETYLSPKQAIEKVLKKREPICGTTACAAGWAVFMFGSKKQIKDCIREKADWSDTASDLLGMRSSEAEIFGDTSLGPERVAEALRGMAAWRAMFT